MKQLIVSLLATAIVLSGCSRETIDQEMPVPGGNVIELIAFGSAENPTEQNKGFGAAYYCYLNLETDSVFVQKRLSSDEQFEIHAWAGTIAGLSQNKHIKEFIEVSQQTKDGNIPATLPNGKFFYDGYHYYSSYKKGGSDRFHFYTTHELEARFENGVNYMMALHQNSKLKPVTRFVDADSMVVHLVNRPAFNEGRLPPSPPVRATINYTPPSEKH